MLSEAVQDYLKTVYKLQNGREGENTVTTSLIAERMGVSAASATNMVKKLAEMHLAEHTPYQGVTLTPTGEKMALEILRHHRLLELYLAEALGYSWDEVHAEAERLEHAISEDFEDRIDQLLGHPSTGAHGEPIPTKQGSIQKTNYRRLADLDAGQTAVVRQVSDHSSEMLRYIGQIGIELGLRLKVEEKAPFDGPMRLHLKDETEHHLGIEVARHIYVDSVQD